jgi:putative toxin-antitoxin system antitoxin component (TIGR02293 family)
LPLCPAVARATPVRCKRQGALTVEEGARVERVARLWAYAMRLFGDEAQSRRFLTTPHMLLRGRRPIDLARSDAGARAVEQTLGGLEFETAV